MKIKQVNYLYFLLFVFFIIGICIYRYNSGSCKINKIYICNNDFCLYKEFNVYLKNEIKNEIKNLTEIKEIKKRVNISTFPETIFNCALPNKKGITISTNNIVKYAPNLIHFYKNDLCKLVSKKLNLNLFPTNLNLPTSCALLIYENDGDWINWHYDYNYYNGRFFTVLVPITQVLTCTKFQFKDKNNNVVDKDLTNNAICFDGNYVYHRASKLCKNQKRVMLSCQYVTDNSISFINQVRIKLKDYAFIGKLF